MRQRLTVRERLVAAATLRKAADKFEWMAHRHGYSRAKGTIARIEEREATAFYMYVATTLREWSEKVLGQPTQTGVR